MSTELTYLRDSSDAEPLTRRKCPVKWRGCLIRAVIVTAFTFGICAAAYKYTEFTFETGDGIGGSVLTALVFLPAAFIGARFALIAAEQPRVAIVALWTVFYVLTAILGPIHGKWCAKYDRLNDTPRVSNVLPSLALPSVVRTGLITLDPKYINTSIWGIGTFATSRVYAITDNSALLYGVRGFKPTFTVQSDGMLWLRLDPYNFTVAVQHLAKRFPNFTLTAALSIVSSTNLLQSITSSKADCQRIDVAFWASISVLSACLLLIQSFRIDKD